jgi:uncharacterized repeat protein (TIGR03803 family)
MRNFVRPFQTRLRALSVALAFVLLSALAAAPAAKAQSYKVLYNFTGGSDGANPYFGSLIQDEAGNLYGTASDAGSHGYGTVFKLTKSGKQTVLYSFTGGADGGYPYATLILSGNMLYGTTGWGGSGNGYSGHGVVFQVNIKTGAETVLYTFTGGADGATSYASLVRDKEGNLYGTTYWGGANNYGTVFKVDPKTKKETVLHSFDDSDGAYPTYGLTFNPSEKTLFGTAALGGSGSYGVVFSLTIKPATYTVLYNFTGGSDGAAPSGTLALDPKGNLYGNANYGGASGAGAVFEVVPKTKQETVLYKFTGGTDGKYPNAGVIRDKKGNLYGTTNSGGSGYGVAFELTKGTETVLHSFDDTDGAYPDCGVLQDSKGNLYGTTEAGGSSGAGVVWEITP